MIKKQDAEDVDSISL